MTMRRRALLAVVVAVVSGGLCYARLWQRGALAADFTWPWRAAQLLVEGQNPYTVIRPEGEYPFQAYFYYPLTAALAALPFALLPALPAGALFFGASSGLLAFALLAEGRRWMGVFLSAPYWVALAVAQWSPLLMAAALLPGLGWLLACKPNLGLAGFAYRPSRAALIGGAAFGLVSLLALPTWPWDWLAVLRTLEGHPAAVLILPLGPLLLLAALRWRTPEGRLLLALSIFPQLLFFYDQLILWLIPKSFRAGAVYAALSWVGYFAWRLTSMDPASGEILRQPTQFILWTVYLPALGMVLWSPEVSRRVSELMGKNRRMRNAQNSPGGTQIDREEKGMQLKVTRWDGDALPSQAELDAIYRQENLSAYAWSNGPGDVYAAHSHAYDKVLYVARGSITWVLPHTGQRIETFPGDRIDLPRGTLHAAEVGPGGVTCLEAHIA